MRKTILLLIILILSLSTVSATTDILKIGESMTKASSTFTVKNIGETSIILIKGSEQKIIEPEDKIKWDGFKVYVESISYDKSSAEKNYVIISVCKDEKETCNNLDDDCDGRIDDNVERDCGIDIGACKKGTQECILGEWGPCQGQVTSAAEICNGKDDNCDGKIDEDIPDRECGIDIGACKKGNQSCEDGGWSECRDSVGRKPETCNEIDDDCDGEVDENACETTEINTTEDTNITDDDSVSGWSKFWRWFGRIF